MDLPADDHLDRRRDRVVARHAAGDPGPARLLRSLRGGHPRPAPGRHPGHREVRRRGFRRAHGGDPARRPDRRRRQPLLLRLPADRRRGRARRLADHHGRAGRGGESRLRARGRRRDLTRPARIGRRRDRRRQPDRTDPALVCRDGHRPGPAPDARRGHPAVDGRLADRASSTGPSSSPPSNARSPAARDRVAGSAC